MKTRSSRAESASKGQGRFFRKFWKSPGQNGHEGSQPAQQCNSQAVLSDCQSPVSSKKLQSHANSQIENLKENCISLNDTMSPIIGNRRRALGPRNVCRNLSSVTQGFQKEKIAPPKIGDNNQKGKVSPLQENVNANTSKKDRGMADVKKQTATKEKNVVPGKENVFAATQTSLRQSKRIKVAKRNKDAQNAPKKDQRDTSTRGQTETKLLSEANSLPKERTVKGAGRKELGPQTKPQGATITKSLKNKTALVQTSNITRSLNKENIKSPHVKASVSAEQDADTCKKELGFQTRPQKATTGKNLKNKAPAVRASDITSGGKRSLISTCDQVHVAAEQSSSSENKESHKTGKDTTVLTRRTSKRTTPRSLGKEDNVDKGDDTPKTIDAQRRVKTKTPAEEESNVKELSPSLESKGKAQTKSKQPVWASVRGIKITPGKRKSFRLGKDAYEFSGSPSKEHKEVKKSKKKPRKLIKKMKPRTKLTLLTTDPYWQGAASKGMLFLGTSLSHSTSKATASMGCLEDSVDDMGEGTSIPSILSSIRDEDATDDFSSEADFDGFEEETRSSFIIPSKSNNKLIHVGSTSVLPTPAASNYKSNFAGNSSTPRMENALRTEAPESVSVPMTSANVLPTPVVSKHITKFIGGSSTPRVENTVESALNQEAETGNDSLAQCFGFTDEPEEESDLNISPVQQSRLRHTLEITGTSDVMDGDLHPATLPSRFSWSSLRPGNRTRTSFTSRSSSVVAQGRSVSLMTDTSSRTSQPTLSSFLVPTVEKQHLRPQRKKLDHSHRDKGSVSIGTEPGKRYKETDVSVLFDENELIEGETSGGKEVSEASQPGSTQSPLNPAAEGTANSPEKSFQKAPRKSYDRRSLLNAKRKFIEMHVGYAGSDSNSEEEEPKTKTHKKTKKASKKSKKPVKETEKKSKKVSSTTSKKKKAAAAAANDPLMNEWVSRLNNHFSEVEESILVVE